MIRETSHAAHRQIRRCAPEMRARILGALRSSPAPITKPTKSGRKAQAWMPGSVA